ncbi:MAG: ABC transporter ATP-binding protein [Planctomycetota bacterium]|nr:ABC transporter ATP-binding protein [Planctomycetota bacterium]
MQEVFVLEEVGFRYPGEQCAVLDRVNLAVPAGKVIALVGLSGSGKTTLLNMLGLLSAGDGETGRITYRDGTRPYPYQDIHENQRAELRKHHFGFVLQSSYLLPHFSCARNIAMPLELCGLPRSRQDAIVTELLEQADAEHQGLLQVRDHLARTVSGGQRQRVAVLRAIVHNPRVVFADEPVSNLDPDNEEITLTMLEHWQQGKLTSPNHVAATDQDGPPAPPRTLILVSHDVEMAWKRAQHFVVVQRGYRGASSSGPLLGGHGGTQATGVVVRAKEDLSGPKELEELMRSRGGTVVP